VFTGGSGVSIGDSLNPFVHGKPSTQTDDAPLDLVNLSISALQDLLLQRLTNAFIYRFTVVNDNVNIQDQMRDDDTSHSIMTTSPMNSSNISMNGFKRKFDEIDTTPTLAADMPDIKRLKTQEDELLKRIAELESKLQEETGTHDE
jgi:hypothetical protein